jgi:two-component system sensor histidine kinase MprB
MRLSTRITLAASAAIIGTTVLAVEAALLGEIRDLRAQIDDDLGERADELVSLAPRQSTDDVVPEHAPTFAQRVEQTGETSPAEPADPRLPVSDRTLEVAAGTRDSFYENAEVAGVTMRVLTVPDGAGEALQVARPIDDIEVHSSHVVVLTTVILGLGTLLAVGLGRLVARAALRPLNELTESARLMAASRDLSHPVEVRGASELRGLADSMNSVVAALAESTSAQRQLVADASHELQTPVAVLRTNVDVLRRQPGMDVATRQAIVDDLDGQLQALSHLVTNLVDLARDGGGSADRRPVQVDDIVLEVIDGLDAEQRGVQISTDLERTVVEAEEDQLVSLVRNLVDNAVRWSPAGSTVTVTLEDDELIVRDRGPGIDAADLPYIFQRFYRSAAARGTSGSGLGLAIVDRAARLHGWTATAENHPAGGAMFRVMFRAPAAAHAAGATAAAAAH